MQGEFGVPSVFRLSDPEETDVAFKLYRVEGTPLDPLLTRLGYLAGERCLLLGHTDGDRDLGKLIKRKIGRICRRHRALPTTGYVTLRWEHGRFRDPYMREDLGDFGIVIDTLECGVNWTDRCRVCGPACGHIVITPADHLHVRTVALLSAGDQPVLYLYRPHGRIEEYLSQAGVLDAIRSGRGDDEPPSRHRQDDRPVARGSDRPESLAVASAQAAL